jgi:hypothetical protein
MTGRNGDVSACPDAADSQATTSAMPARAITPSPTVCQAVLMHRFGFGFLINVLPHIRRHSLGMWRWKVAGDSYPQFLHPGQGRHVAVVDAVGIQMQRIRQRHDAVVVGDLARLG